VTVPELAQYHQQFEKVKAEAEELTQGLDEARFNWRPSPDEWSIEECLGHLIIVGNREITAIETAVEDGRTRGIKAVGPFRPGPIERLIVELSRPPARLKFDAPRQFQPLHGQPLTAVMPSFLHLQRQFQIQLERAEGLDLSRVKVVTPISQYFRMSLNGMFAQIAAHERRHLEQARRVRRLMAA
jgi:hypothetical protein